MRQKRLFVTVTASVIALSLRFRARRCLQIGQKVEKVEDFTFITVPVEGGTRTYDIVWMTVSNISQSSAHY